MKKILGILLAVCFLMSVTAAVACAEPVVVTEKKVMAVNGETGQKIAAQGVAVKSETGQKMIAARGAAVNSKTGKKIAARGVAVKSKTGKKMVAAEGVAVNSKTGKKIVATEKVAMKNGKDKAINS
jgi:lipopolysaccharide assembly outer membrane protein LptD (OstA)